LHARFIFLLNFKNLLNSLQSHLLTLFALKKEAAAKQEAHSRRSKLNAKFAKFAKSVFNR